MNRDEEYPGPGRYFYAEQEAREAKPTAAYISGTTRSIDPFLNMDPNTPGMQDYSLINYNGLGFNQPLQGGAPNNFLKAEKRLSPFITSSPRF